MEEYLSNSHKSKEQRQKQLAERPKVEKVVRGTVKTKKKSELRKLADAFISEDAKSVKSYIILDVLIPAAKKVISDIVTNSIDMFLWGESGVSKRRSSSSRISYRDYYDSSRRIEESPRRSVYTYDDIVFDDRGEAEEVLTRMDELIDAYGVVSVADMFDLAGITAQYTDNNYGWNSIRSATVDRVRDGYILRMPQTRPLK